MAVQWCASIGYLKGSLKYWRKWCIGCASDSNVMVIFQHRLAADSLVR